MSFAQLHLHTSAGSMLDAVSSSEDYAKKASELNHKYLAITDHGRLTGILQHQNACRKYDVHPVLGLEQYIIPDDELVTLNNAGKRVRCRNNHIILLAKNQIGLENLTHLHYISMAEENHFYYNNHTTFSELFKYSEGVICGTACMMSPFSNLLKDNKPEDAENLFKIFLDVFKDNFYVELQLNELTKQLGDNLANGQKSVNDFMVSLADKYGVPKVITGDVHYANKEDSLIQDVSLAMREKRTVNDEGFTLESRTLFYHDVNDYKFFNKQFGYNYSDDFIDELCNNAEYIASKCNAEIPERTRMIFPSVTTEDEFELEKITINKLNEKFNNNPPKEYIDRLNYELSILKKKGFASYFMVLHDIFNFCKEKNILYGFSRGSGCGALTSYLLGISAVDPLRYGLSFERFLNEARCVDTVVDYWSDINT